MARSSHKSKRNSVVNERNKIDGSCSLLLKRIIQALLCGHIDIANREDNLISLSLMTKKEKRFPQAIYGTTKINVLCNGYSYNIRFSNLL